MKHLKQEFDSLSFRDIVSYSLAIICMVSGIVCVFLSMYIEPVGEIHSSVLMYFGIASSFCGAILGIEAKYKYSLERFKADILATLGNAEDRQIESAGISTAKRPAPQAGP